MLFKNDKDLNALTMVGKFVTNKNIAELSALYIVVSQP